MNKMHIILTAVATVTMALTNSCQDEKITAGVIVPKEPVVTPSTEAMGDNLVATDALGRTLPTYEEAGDVTNRHIGLFYWLWHGGLRNDSSNPLDYDNTLALAANPTKTDWTFADHYWAEPELGYYLSSDEFVIRKHLNLFTLIGIDFLYLDFTNELVNANELSVLLSVIMDMQSKGYNPPRLVPFMNVGKMDVLFEQLYNDFYMKPEYADCWFNYGGKPLMLSPVRHSSNDAINDFFTWRHMWAAFERNDTNRHMWKFFDEYPMDVAISNGRVEQGVVSPGTGGPLWDAHIYGSRSSKHNYTPTYDQYWVSEETPLGLFFEEQWEEAFKNLPPVLCITGWNELKAGAWYVDETLANAGFKFQGRVCNVGDMYFVDQFNAEFSRDIEPMKGGLTDNYFYQAAYHLRKYKGMKPMPESSDPQTIAVDGIFAEWEMVTPAFGDFEGDTAPRSSNGAPKGTRYTNTTGRNDIVETRVAYDDNNVYFYVKSASELTSHTNPFWMLLYIDADRNKQTGWEGYDYLINNKINSATQTVLMKRDGDKWIDAATIDYAYAGNQIEIAVPRSAIGQSAKPDFYFHWHDNIGTLDDLHSFFVNGDSAPERRYNYHYKAK